MWRPVICGLVLAMLAPRGLSQTPSEANTPRIPEKDLCSVTGLVVHAATGLPLKRASVFMNQGGGSTEAPHYEAHSDEAGRFSIERIVPGRYNLIVIRRGYVSQSYGQSVSGGSGSILTLAPGEKMPDLLFRMVPWSVISGRITDEEGEPLPGVEVFAMRGSFRNGKRSFMEMERAETNDLGEYRIWDLQKGHYVIRAEYRGSWSSGPAKVTLPGSDVPAGYAPIFYPRTPDVTRAVSLDVGVGQDMPGVDFIFLPSRAVRIRGHVFDGMLGRPASGVSVLLHRIDPQAFSFSSSGVSSQGPGGAFELRAMVAGSYEVVARLRTEGEVRSGHRRIEVGNTDVDGVDLTILHGVDIRGRVIVEKAGDFDLSQLRVRLSPEDQPIFGPPAAVKHDGTFLINEVADGMYQVQVLGRPDGTFLKSVRAAGQDVLAGISIDSGAFKAPLEIVLSGAGAVVDGVVADQESLPVAGATVVLIPREEALQRDQFEKRVTTDQHGKFVVRDVRPGAYRAFAWREVEYGEWNDPDFMKPIEDKGVPVSAEENGHVTVELKVLPSATPANPPQ